VEEAAKLDTAALDYAIAGPVFATESKPGYGPPLGIAGFATIVKAISVPVIAIGGIDADAVAELFRAGAAGIAVMGGVMRATDPATEVRQLLANVATARNHPRPR
jgi:thiamine-phosphate pyrophosphorylase